MEIEKGRVMESKIERLKRLTDKMISFEILRKKNLDSLKNLYKKLNIEEKIDNFDDIFEFKAMNLSGVSLNEKDLGEIKKGKYIQIIAIKKDENEKLKNINLKYLGRAEKIEENLKNDVVEFVLRWRLEKNFRGVEHYKNLIHKIKGKNV